MNTPKDDDSFRPKSSSHSTKDRTSFGSRSGTLSGGTSAARIERYCCYGVINASFSSSFTQSFKDF